MDNSDEVIEAVRYVNFASLQKKYVELAEDYRILEAAHNRLVEEHENLVAVVAELQIFCNRLR